MVRRPQKLPDYFTAEKAEALVAAAPSYTIRMAFRIMLRTGLRVSEALSLRRSDLQLNQDPPVISIRPEVPRNKARKGREVPIPLDLLQSLADLASFHSKNRDRPMLDISHQRVGESMKRAASREGVNTLGPPDAEEGRQGHFATAALSQAGPAADFPADYPH